MVAAGKSRYMPPGRPETAVLTARAIASPMSSALSIRNAFLQYGLATLN